MHVARPGEVCNWDAHFIVFIHSVIYNYPNAETDGRGGVNVVVASAERDDEETKRGTVVVTYIHTRNMRIWSNGAMGEKQD